MSQAIQVTELPEMIEIEIVCTTCEGEKTVERTILSRNSDDPYEGITVTCPDCQGRGIEIKEVCSGCNKSEYECTCQ